MRVREAAGTTPGRHRLWSVGAAVVLVVATVAITASASRMRASTRRAEQNSGPVLVATQQLVASLAEADAAATSAFLSGSDEDPEQRRLYEQALARANEQVDEIASLTGSDAAVKTVLGRVSVRLTRYAGLVEAARATNKAGSPDANGYLVSAVRLADQVVAGDVKILTDATSANLRHDESGRTAGLAVMIGAVLAALVVLGLGQMALTRASRRLLNVPLIVATVLTLVAGGWAIRAAQTSGSALAGARRHGYDSIVITARLGSAGFGAKSAETLALITSDAGQRSAADADARDVATSTITPEVADSIRSRQSKSRPGGLITLAANAADTARERAAVAETALRWQRYQTTVASLRAAPSPAAAKVVAEGQANADFNGFNFSVESILGQNRVQFLDGLASAADRTRRLPTGVLLLMLGALATMLWGFQLRIDDYR